MYALLVVAFYIAVIYGWVHNIVILLAHTGPIVAWGALEVARVAGIFVPPLGVVLGYV